MKVWWVLSVILVTLMLVMLVLAASSMPFVLRAVSVVFVALWMIALVYFVVRRW
jgi:hypothetical protein